MLLLSFSVVLHYSSSFGNLSNFNYLENKFSGGNLNPFINLLLSALSHSYRPVVMGLTMGTYSDIKAGTMQNITGDEIKTSDWSLHRYTVREHEPITLAILLDSYCTKVQPLKKGKKATTYF